MTRTHRKQHFPRCERLCGLALFGSAAVLVAGCGGTSNVTAQPEGEAGSSQSAGGRPSGGAAGAGGEGLQDGVGGSGDAGATGRGGDGTVVGGGAGRGGTAGAGGTSAGAGDAGTGAGPTGTVGPIGDECAPRGALACAGNQQKIAVVCGADDTWEIRETCQSGEYCDSTEGPDVGLCKQGSTACAGAPAGSLVCDDQEILRCSVDALGTLVDTCEFDCLEGVCHEACAENVLMNCTDECGGPANCAEACGPGQAGAAPPPFLAADNTLVPGVTYRIRLPVVAESDSCAAAGCSNLMKEGADAKRGIAVLFPTNYDAPLFRVTVEAPWAFGFPALIEQDTDVCGGMAMSGAELTCVTRHEPGPGELGLWIVTSDPTPTSALVTIEVGDETLPDCP